MIKAYLAGISTLYEGEDIEVRYRIYEEEELLCKEDIMLEYKKPTIVGLVSFITLLKKLERYVDKEMVVIINDGALFESIRGTSGTKDRDVQEMAKRARRELRKFVNLDIRNVSGSHIELGEWSEVLKA